MLQINHKFYHSTIAKPIEMSIKFSYIIIYEFSLCAFYSFDSRCSILSFVVFFFFFLLFFSLLSRHIPVCVLKNMREREGETNICQFEHLSTVGCFLEQSSLCLSFSQFMSIKQLFVYLIRKCDAFNT